MVPLLGTAWQTAGGTRGPVHPHRLVSGQTSCPMEAVVIPTSLARFVPWGQLWTATQITH